MLNRKDFILKGLMSLATAKTTIASSSNNYVSTTFNFDVKEGYETADLAKDEDFWGKIRDAYQLNDDFFQFNHGSVSPHNKSVLNNFIENHQFANQAPAKHIWNILNKQREDLRNGLANFLNADNEEIAINRNTTEGLANIIFGLDLEAGDEVVLSMYDYPFMVNMWEQRARRDKIKINYVDFDFPEEDEEKIIEKYRAAITEKTKIVHLTWVMNWTGQIMPVEKITKMTKEKNCEVIVDGAHALGQVEVDLKKVNCDYFAASLHKWMGAPYGTGLMYMKKEKISKVWSLTSNYESQLKDIRKFENLGTRSIASEISVLEALKQHELIGTSTKKARLQYLKNHIIRKIWKLDNVDVYTSMEENLGAGMVTFSIKNMTGLEVYNQLNGYNIHASPVTIGKLSAVRVSPNFFTAKSDIDYLLKIIHLMASN